MTDTFINPFSDSPLLCISNDMMATDEVSNDLMNAKQKGQDAMTSFTENRSSSTATKSLFYPIKNMKFKTLSSMTKIVKTRLCKKVIPIKATRPVCTHCYPLGPLQNL